MSVGIAVTKADLDFRAGVIAKEFQQLFQDAVKLNTYLVATVDADLIALGYTAGEVANLKTAFSDMTQLDTIFRGSANLAVAKDFRTFISRIWGFGSF